MWKPRGSTAFSWRARAATICSAAADRVIDGCAGIERSRPGRRSRPASPCRATNGRDYGCPRTRSPTMLGVVGTMEEVVAPGCVRSGRRTAARWMSPVRPGTRRAERTNRLQGHGGRRPRPLRASAPAGLPPLRRNGRRTRAVPLAEVLGGDLDPCASVSQLLDETEVPVRGAGVDFEGRANQFKRGVELRDYGYSPVALSCGGLLVEAVLVRVEHLAR